MKTLREYIDIINAAYTQVSEGKEVYWLSPLNDVDDFGDKFTDTMIDGKTNMGPWANMTPRSWAKHGVGQFGVGLGQLYKKQPDGRWLKIKG